MREIKFRAWDKKKKEMFPVHKIEISPNGGHLIKVKGYDDWDKDGWTVHGGGIMKYANENRYELMQFTGLKDKNGCEIYEGDVVKIEHPESEIMSGVYSVKRSPETMNVVVGIYNLGNGPYKFAIVIGNIYEHPHLLSEVK